MTLFSRTKKNCGRTKQLELEGKKAKKRDRRREIASKNKELRRMKNDKKDQWEERNYRIGFKNLIAVL